MVIYHGWWCWWALVRCQNCIRYCTWFPIPFLHTVDADMIAYRQGKTRKGSYAAYMNVAHPDIMEFLNIRIPTGDVQRKALNIHNAINITDKFMTAVMTNSDFDLIDPNDKSVKETVSARKLWERILEIRFRTGEPYLNFIDTANNICQNHSKKKDLKYMEVIYVMKYIYQQVLNELQSVVYHH